jgi:hypothetical protein
MSLRRSAGRHRQGTFLFALGLLALSVSATEPVSPSARFAAALPGYQVARVLWAEGKLVLEHEGRLVVLRQGDSLPGRPEVRLIEINDRGVTLADAASGVPGTSVLRPDRLIRLAPSLEHAEAFDVTLMSAQPQLGPVPERAPEHGLLPLGPGGPRGVIDAKSDGAVQDAPPVTPTRAPVAAGGTQGGGGR